MAAGEKVVAKEAEHVVAKAVQRAGVRDAEQIAAKDGARTAEETVAKGAEEASTRELSTADRAALTDYTSNNYRELNNYNRGVGNPTAEEAAALEQRSQAVSDALHKLPDHEGTVYRGTDLSPELATKYRPGEVVREDAFTSTSTTSPFGGNTAYTIDSKHGKDVAPYSQYPGEAEILFDRGTQFKVLSNDERDGVRYIHMIEV